MRSLCHRVCRLLPLLIVTQQVVQPSVGADRMLLYCCLLRYASGLQRAQAAGAGAVHGMCHDNNTMLQIGLARS